MIRVIIFIMRCCGLILNLFRTKTVVQQSWPLHQPPIGSQFSYFRGTPEGLIGFKNYLPIQNQNETLFYGDEYITVDVREKQVAPWLEEQDVSLWKFAEETDDCHFSFRRYIVHEHLYTLLELKWGL